MEALPLFLCLLLLTDLLLLSEEGEVVLVVPAAVSVVPLDSDHQVCDSGAPAGRQEEECRHGHGRGHGHGGRLVRLSQHD